MKIKKIGTWATRSPVLVGPDQRPDQDHRGARRADHVGKTAPTARMAVFDRAAFPAARPR